MKNLIISIALLLYFCCPVYGIDTRLRTAPDGFQFSFFEELSYLGVKNKNGVIIIPAFYTNIKYTDGLFIVKNISSIYSVYYNTGEVLLYPNDVIDIKYDEGIKQSPLVLLTKRNTYRVMDRSGKILVPEDVYGYVSIKKDTINNDYYFRIEKNGFYGIVDKTGKVIIPPDKYNRLERYDLKNSCYYTFVTYNNNCNQSGVCNQFGKEIIRTPYYETIPQVDKNRKLVYRVNLCNRYGYLDSKGKPIQIPSDTSDVIFRTTFNGINYDAVLTCKGKLGLMKDGHYIIPKDCDKIMEGKKFISVIKGPYWGLYDYNGNCIVAPNKYNLLVDMGDYILASKDGNHTQLDLQGHELFPLKYRSVFCLKADNVTAWAATGIDTGKDAIISSNLEQLTPFAYDQIDIIKDTSTNKGLGYIVFQDGKVGICSLNGKEIVDVAYTDIGLLSYKSKYIYTLYNGNKIGACKPDGTIFIPAEIFDKITLEGKNVIATAPNRKCVFSLDGKLLSDSHPETERDKYVALADAEFEKKNWDKAAKYYGKAIEQVPSAVLYYNKAISHYNNDSYKQAIKDFNQCLSLNPSQNLIEKSTALIAKSQELQAEKVARRQAVWGNVLGLALGVATTYAASQLSSGSYTSRKAQRDDLSYLLDPNYAIQQVQLQYWREYITETNGGRTMTYEEWMAIRAQAYANSQNGNSGGVSSSTSGGSYNGGSSSNSSSSSGGSMCRACAGMKWCRTCEGKGFYYSSFDLSKKLPCPNCYDHNGKCAHCNGTGIR